MTAIGVVLIIIGTIFMIGSFFVSEKLSGAEINEMAKLSQTEMHRMLEKELEAAQKELNQKINEKVDQAVDAAIDDVERKIDKETNDKIMAIDDFSNTVIENMNKTHSEIMFLYGMLNDKQASISETVEQAQSLMEKSKESEIAISNAIEQLNSQIALAEAKQQENQKILIEEQGKDLTTKMDDTFNQIIQMEENGQNEFDLLLGKREIKDSIEEEKINHNLEILALHRQGKTNVEIAKKLSLGMGEVKLVLDLFREEEKA